VGSCPVTMKAAQSVTATFNPVFELSVTDAGTGTGTVSSSPAGISCGGTCSAEFLSGTTVTLSAAPAADSVFAGWSEACSGTETCTVTMNAAVAASKGCERADVRVSGNPEDDPCPDPEIILAIVQ
jgi:hypothetical protein